MVGALGGWPSQAQAVRTPDPPFPKVWSSSTPAPMDQFRLLESVLRIPSKTARMLSAICWVETNHNYNSIVHTPKEFSLGVCQVQLSTARWLGFKGTQEELLEPIVNIYYAYLYFQYQLNRYHHYLKAVKAYNKGNCKGLLRCRYVRRVLKAYQEKR